jgi:hypothetical protein
MKIEKRSGPSSQGQGKTRIEKKYWYKRNMKIEKNKKKEEKKGERRSGPSSQGQPAQQWPTQSIPD